MYRVTIMTGSTVTRHEYENESTARAVYLQAKQRAAVKFERVEIGTVGRVSNRNKTLETYYRWELEKWVKAVEDRDLKAQKRIEKSLLKLQNQALSCGCLETLTKQRRAIK